MGSINDNQSGGDYAYRMSKAALDMMSRSLSIDLRAEGITSVVINPGWVQTDMGGRGAPTWSVTPCAASCERSIARPSPTPASSSTGRATGTPGS